jgi:hypothetical protein
MFSLIYNCPLKSEDCMCKEMSVIPVNRVVDKKTVTRKNEGQGGGEAQGADDPLKSSVPKS